MLTSALLAVHPLGMPLTSLCCRIDVKTEQLFLLANFFFNALYVPGTVLSNLLPSSHLIFTLVL